MRVAHLIASLNPAQGGPPAVAARLASAQASLGVATTLVAAQPTSDLAAVESSLRQIRGIDGVAIAFTSPRRSAANVLRDLNVDVVHVHGLWRPGLLFALQWARWNALPFVITPHGMLSRWSLSQKPLRKRAALAAGWRRLLVEAGHTHALNEIEALDILNVEPRARIAVLPNGVDAAELQSTDFSEPSAVTAGRRYVLFLARLHRMKAPDLAVEAFATIAHRFPDVDLIVAGPDEGERVNVVARVARLQLGSRVKIIGPVYGSAKIALLQNAVCVIQPSRYEGQSVTLLEALAAGAPLVLTAECNFPEAQAAGAAIMAPGDAEHLGEALAALLSDAVLRQASSERGRRLIAEKFQWPQIGSQFINLYKSLTGDTSTYPLALDEAS